MMVGDVCMQEELVKLEEEEERQQRRLEQIEKQAAGKRKEHAREHKQLVKMEDDVKKKEKEVKALRPKHIKLDEQIKHAQAKLDEAKAALSKAAYTHDKKADTIAQLEACQHVQTHGDLDGE
jgi:septal ring factor EnvC (AmiA/AmiB activator)